MILTLVLFPYYLLMFMIGRPAKMILVGQHMQDIVGMHKENIGVMHSTIKDKVFGKIGGKK